MYNQNFQQSICCFKSSLIAIRVLLSIILSCGSISRFKSQSIFFCTTTIGAVGSLGAPATATASETLTLAEIDNVLKEYWPSLSFSAKNQMQEIKSSYHLTKIGTKFNKKPPPQPQCALNDQNDDSLSNSGNNFCNDYWSLVRVGLPCAKVAIDIGANKGFTGAA